MMHTLIMTVKVNISDAIKQAFLSMLMPYESS